MPATDHVSCRGDNVYGQLGTAINDNNPVPATIARLSDITALTNGNGDHTCALNSMGEVFQSRRDPGPMVHSAYKIQLKGP